MSVPSTSCVVNGTKVRLGTSWRRPVMLRSERSSFRFRKVACASSQSVIFRHNFHPEMVVEADEAPLMRDAEAGLVTQEGGPRVAAREMWETKLPGSFWVSNPLAKTRMRLAHIPSPSDKVPFPFKREEYYSVDMEVRQASGRPRVVRGADGEPVLHPGFLGGTDYRLPRRVAISFLERFQYSKRERMLHTAVAAVCMCGAVAAFTALWGANHNLALLLGLGWVTNSLTLPRLGGLLALAACRRLWLCWVWGAGMLVDRLLANIAPPVRTFMHRLFSLWLVYLALSPQYMYPIPFLFTPGADAMVDLLIPVV